MENTVKIILSAVTHIGAACAANDDRIYADGRFLRPSVANYAQVSLELNKSKCLFAVYDGMDDEESGISLMNDIEKFHQKAISSSKDIHVKLDDLVQYVEQASNLLHSVSLGENDFRTRKTAFAGLLIDEGSVAAVNMGSCRIYKLEGNTFKLLVNDYKRAERLLKMGIISSEQAELLAGQQKNSLEEGRSTVKKSDIYSIREGLVYLICSCGLTDSVSEDAIYDILASCTDPDEAAAQLVAEAVGNECEDNATAMVIRIENSLSEESEDDYKLASAAKRNRSDKMAKMTARPGASHAANAKVYRTVDIGKIFSTFILIVLAAAVFFGGYRLWLRIRNPADQDASHQQNSTGSSYENSADFTGIDEGTDDPAGVVGDGTAEGTQQDNTDIVDEPGTVDSDPVGPDGVKYIVKSGDMLVKISKEFYGDESKYILIMEANNLTDPDKIFVGQELFIPPLK